MPPAIVHARAQIKRAAAEVNSGLGLLEATKAAAMVTAATRIAAGELENQFPLPV
jgi:fumarate hydratase class II